MGRSGAGAGRAPLEPSPEMKRLAVGCCVLLVLGASIPARAHGVEGIVRLPAASPTVPRTLYMVSHGQDGLTGSVVRLEPGAAGRTYTLTLLSGATGLENLDAYLYTDLGGTGTPCPVAAEEHGRTETGTISCPAGVEPTWAVIVLRTGANARFSFSY